jgi:hypothetical protein
MRQCAAYAFDRSDRTPDSLRIDQCVIRSPFLRIVIENWKTSNNAHYLARVSMVRRLLVLEPYAACFRAFNDWQDSCYRPPGALIQVQIQIGPRSSLPMRGQR